MGPYWLMVAALAGLALQEQNGSVIAQWIAEIEGAGGGRVVVGRVEWDTDNNQLRLASGTGEREAFAEFLRQEPFVRELVKAQALTISSDTLTGQRHLIFLNMARASEFAGAETALLAHELGHVALRAKGYPRLEIADGPLSCVAIHSTDAVQHVLIRKEMERRGIDHRASWIRALEGALDQWKERPLPAQLSPCERVQAASQWVDVRLGIPDGEWRRKAEYEVTLGRRYPEIEEAVAGIAALLADRDLADIASHGEALGEVGRRLQQLANSTTTLKTNQ